MERDNVKAGMNSFWGSIAFLCGFIAMLLFSSVLTYIVDEDLVTTVYSYGSQILFIATALLFASLTKNDHEKNGLKTGFAKLGLNKGIGIRQILLIILVAILAIVAFLPVSTLFEYVFARMGYEVEPNYPDFTSSIGALISGIVCLSILPAIGEELLLRGAFMRGLRERGTIFAILVSALVFALMHGSPTQFIYQLILGIIVAYIVYITDSVYSSMIFHFINNFAVVLFNYFADTLGFSLNIPLWLHFLMFFLGTPALLTVLYFFTNVTVKRNPTYSAIKEEAIREKGKKGLFYAIFEQSDFGYVKYNRKYDFILIVLFAVVIAVWILNTIAGWI